MVRFGSPARLFVLFASLAVALTVPVRSFAQAPPPVTVFGSGISAVTTWDPIFPASAYPDASVLSTPTQLVGPGPNDPNWINSHPASVFGKGVHPWEFIRPMNFDANWINAWSDIYSRGPAGQSWTKYSTTVTGEGDFVLQFLADNVSWIYLDGALVGYQDWYWEQVGTGRYTIHLTGAGPHELVFIIWDGGGAAGGKFRLETTQSFLDNGGGTLPPPPPPPSDTTAPVITAPGSIAREATGPNGAVVAFSATATDNVDATVSVSATPASGSTFPLGVTHVNLSATDAAGNIGFATFTVTVRDTTAPAVTAPKNVTAEATSPYGALVTFANATANDIVGVTFGPNCSPSSGSTFALGTTTVSCSATDAAGNIGAATFTVTVRDTIAPALTLPASQVVEATSAAGVVATFAASATDAVGVTPLTYSKASGSTFSLGTTSVTVTATDDAGNASSASFTVTVRDTTAPVITSLSTNAPTLWPPNHKMVAVTVSALATDLVGVSSLKIISATSSEPDNGLGDGDTAGDIQVTGDMTLNLRAERSGKGNGRTYTITVEARDAAGNKSTKTCTVFVPKSQGGR